MIIFYLPYFFSAHPKKRKPKTRNPPIAFIPFQKGKEHHKFRCAQKWVSSVNKQKVNNVENKLFTGT